MTGLGADLMVRARRTNDRPYEAALHAGYFSGAS